MTGNNEIERCGFLCVHEAAVERVLDEMPDDETLYDLAELFKLFALRRREGVSSLEELRQKEASPKVAQAIAAQLGLSMEQARRLHLDMLIYTVGLGTIFSVTMPGIPAQEVFARQERAYQAFLKQAKEEPGHEE